MNKKLVFTSLAIAIVSVLDKFIYLSSYLLNYALKLVRYASTYAYPSRLGI